MEVSSKSWFSDESDDDSFVDIQSKLKSVNHLSLPADGEAGGKRRTEKLVGRKNSDEITQKLIDLSALVPGPNEIDEHTVISKTIKYMKELQETVNLLEDQMSREQPANKKTKLVLPTDDEAASEDTASSHRPGKVSGYDHEIDTSDNSLPEIEARFLKKDVFVRIHCRKSNELLIVDIINHLENLHLSPVRNSSVLHFGSSHLEIALVAQMEEGFSMTVKELIRSLRMAFSPSI